MNSIKRLLVFHVFKYVLIIFLSTIFLLNIAFYLFSNNQYQKEIDRQYRSLYNMSAHLATESNLDTLKVYLEHYTHINEVTLHFKDAQDITLFTNDQEAQLSKFEAVYYEDMIVGYLAVNFESSFLSKDMLSGFLGLNLISITLFTLGVLILYQYLKKESLKIKNDLDHIEDQHVIFAYQEIKHIHKELMRSFEQKDKQKSIYESHIKRLAHDIKTPLSVIQIYAESFLKQSIVPNDEMLKDLLDEVKKISLLVPKFIELDYVELPYEQDISIFIEKYIAKYKEVFDSKHIHILLKLEPLLVIISDQDLKRLVEHLIFNAFYYSKEQSTIHINVLKDERKLCIEDQGIGMSDETINKILKGPYRAEEARRLHEKGSGLGYQIIKDIVRKLNADLKIQSSIGQGTSVCIYFK